MLSPEVLQQLHTVLQNSTDIYEVARAAGFLQTRPDHAAAAAPHFLRALKMLRLNNAADRFAGAAQPSSGGLIPWRSRVRRFAANVAALAVRQPLAAALVQESIAALKDFELHQTADGNFEVLDLRKSLPLGWLGGLANHKQAADGFQFDRQKMSVPQPIAFDGISFGWMLLRIFQATEKSFISYSCPFYIFEPEPSAIAMLFHMHDLTQLIAGPRLRWFVGNSEEAVIADFRAALEKNLAWTLPGTVVRCTLLERPPIGIQSEIAHVQADREARRQSTREQIAAHYAGKTPATWRERFNQALAPGTAQPLRVLGRTSRFTTVLQYSMAELQAAVRQAGMEMEVAIEPDDQSLEDPWLELIASFKPDLIVQISRMRYENPQLPANIPFLTWDQDNLVCMRTPQATASLDALTFVAGHGALHGYLHMNWPLRNVIFCHLAAATHRYQPRPVTSDEQAQLACDFSYVSNAAASPTALRDQHLQRFGEGAVPVFAAACDLMLSNPLDPLGFPWNEVSVRTALRQIAADRRIGLPDETLRELLLSALLVADRAFRHETLQWVSDFCSSAGKSLRIYGSGWETHPTLGRHAAGMARQGEHLQAITLATRINLQIIGTGVLHSRLLDGLAAGGFFMFRRTLTDWNIPAFQAALEQVSRHVFAHDLQSFAALDALADPGLRSAWEQEMAGYYRRDQRLSGLDERIVLRSIGIAHRLKHSSALLPELDGIAFESPAELAARAAAFLDDPAARAAATDRLRAAVVEQFSYDARWRDFVRHIHKALQ